MAPELEDDLSGSVAFQLRQAEAAVRAAADHRLAATGLTLSQYFVLRLVRAVPGSSSADLARRYGVSPRAMTGLVAALESAGLIERMDHPAHGRIKLISLTAEGEHRSLVAQRVVDELERALCGRQGMEAVSDWLRACARDS
jgi:DNA-binding MarR family transcriptional regulator